MSLFYSYAIIREDHSLITNKLILINKDKNAITYLNSLCKICLKNIVCTSFYL